jgi:hypothetical protein
MSKSESSLNDEPGGIYQLVEGRKRSGKDNDKAEPTYQQVIDAPRLRGAVVIIATMTAWQDWASTCR